MNATSVTPTVAPHRIGRSILALLVGIVLVVVLSLATDVVLHALGVFPPLGQYTPSGPLLLATLYRFVFGVIGSYFTARLAPYKPMQHALVGGFIGLVLGILGAAVTWNRGLGPRWYPVALVVLALPQAWLGGKLRLTQLSSGSA